MADQALSLHGHHSPLRYPGGKGKLANYVKALFLANNLVGSEYVEPYAGGGSVALALLYEEYAAHVHINDVNAGVFAFWNSVVNHTEDFCALISNADLTIAEWERQREIYRTTTDDQLALGFATFYLNRTSRSGIIGGGVIGGLDQTGKWKINARFNRDDLGYRVRKIGRYRSRISVSGDDAESFVKNEVPSIDDAFVYLDPPYYVKGEGLYESFYRHDDHAAIASKVADLEARWIVSYDAAPEIEALYESYRSIRYGLSYSASQRYRGSEIMFFDERLVLPEVDSPSSVPASLVEALRSAA